MKVLLLFLLSLSTSTVAVAQGPEGKRSESKDALTLKQLEQDWLDSYREGDADKMGKILADDFVGRWADGSSQTREEQLKAIRTGEEKHSENQLVECNVRIYGSTAVVTGINTEQSILEGRDGSGTISFTDVFVKRDGRWQVVASETKKVAEQQHTTVEEEAIMKLERQWAKAEETYDPKALEEIMAKGYVSMNGKGEIQSKAQEIASDREPPAEHEVVDDMSVRMFGDAAVVLGRFTWTDRNSVSAKLQGRFVDTMIRRGGQWKVVANSYVTTMTPSKSEGR